MTDLTPEDRVGVEAAMAMTMGPKFTAAMESVYGLPLGFMSEGHDGETVGVIACAIMDGRIPPFSEDAWERMPGGRWRPPATSKTRRTSP